MTIYEELVIYRNELKNKNMYRYKMIGIVTELLLSKDVFKHNADIGEFIKSVFGMEFKNYIMKSRTMIVARISKMLILSNNNKLYATKLLEFIIKKIDDVSTTEEKNKKNTLDGWIR